MMEVRSRLTGTRGVSLPFTDAVEPLAPDQQSADFLFERIQREAEASNWKYAEWRGWKSYPSQAATSLSYYGHSIDLTGSDDIRFRRCSEPTRRGVRKAQKSDLTIEIASSEAAMREYFRLHCITRQRQGSPPQPLEFFLNLQRHLLARNLGCIVTARLGKALVASAVYLHHGHHVVYKFGASDEAFQNLRANNLVMWSAIQHFAARDFRILDFGRTSIAHAGLRRFKLGWGAQEQIISYVRFSPKRGFLKVSDQTSGWQTAVFRRLPRPMSRLAGAILYRHVA